MNNPALDIAIGLIFIYAIFSLLVTALTEIVTVLLKLRGKNLQEAIHRMLDNSMQSGIADSEAGDVNKQLPENLSGLFFNQPEIRFLGNISKRGKEIFPTYIKPKTFANSLLHAIGYVYSDDTNLSSLKANLDEKNPTHLQIINMIDEAGSDLEKFKELSADWFNDTMDRASEWYQRKTRLITFLAGMVVAFALNVNTIEITRQLGTNDEARLEMVNAAAGYVQSYQDAGRLTKNERAQIDSLNVEVHHLLKESQHIGSIVDFKFNLQTYGDWLLYIFGCLLTAIALSLGSPFWFDLLNRLFRLRNIGGAGVKGERQA
ncbi:hypothetical protein ACT3CD_04240 [Geofilum sp. OHC36d9]|uniref:hypothetical protein n=1 Tax=Geofilum sp. OHC36d9 TaxID=3458413 RepID=UPI0040340F93